MKVRVPHYYDTFSCTGSACPDTCCVGWMIEIDEESYQRFMKMEGEFGKRLRANIMERPDGHFFALNEQGRCSFLNSDNLCEMVINMGDSSLCSLCNNYPRVGVEFGGLREMGLSISCPEVAKLILSSKRAIRFGEWYQEDIAKGPDYTRDALFVKLLDARDVLFGILQNRDLTIAQRMNLYLMYASQLQNVLDEDDLQGADEKILHIMELFSDEAYLQKAVGSVKEANTQTCLAFMKQLCEYIDSLEIINEKWKNIFQGTYDDYTNTQTSQTDAGLAQNWESNLTQFRENNQEWNYAYEHLMVYYVFRYFLKMVFDGDIYSKAVMCGVALLMTNAMARSCFESCQKVSMEDMIHIFYLFSKEIEHCEENLERLTEEYWDNEIYQPISLIPIIAKIL